MAQTLLIGLGGTGSRVVNKVVAQLNAKGKTINDGNLCCVVLDTNKADIDLIGDTGTGVPIVATSKPQKIEDYFLDYFDKGIEEWSPTSAAFKKQSMLLGASEMRVKSRIAFMDTDLTGGFKTLEDMINKMRMLNTDTKISVMIVTSLSGGTGSGMFIQTALWLRQHLAGAVVVMRAVFLMPDVFASLDCFRSNASTKLRHYANAYAAIRELNAISMIRNNGTVELPQDIKLDNLFDSAEGSQGEPVFDFAFLIDDKDENGVSLGSVPAYESAAADLIYMQLYAPLTATMYSEEDNIGRASGLSVNPLFASCGTSRVYYPSDDVVEYCKLRAVKDSLTSGWRRIDDEITALKDELKQRGKKDTIDAKSKYIEIYDRETIGKKPEERDDFFGSIADDSLNKIKVGVVDGEMQYRFSDKISDFSSNLIDKIIKPLVIKEFNPEKFSLDPEEFVKAEHTVEELITQVNNDVDGFNSILRRFDSSKDKHVDNIVERAMTFTMKDGMEQIANTVMSLFVGYNEDDDLVFVHPVSARYLIIKLIEEFKAQRKNINPDDIRLKVLAENDEDAPKFDSKATKGVVEATALEYLHSKKWFQKESTFTDIFEKDYAEFMNTKVTYCVKYLVEALSETIFKELELRLEALLKKFAALFNDLDEVKAKVDGEIEKYANSVSHSSKTLVVYARPEHKEKVYKSLTLDFTSGTGINKSIVTALYGSMCADARPKTESNKKYFDLSIVDTFVNESKELFGNMITTDPENKKKVFLTIYQAICKECDATMSGNEATAVKKQRYFDKFIEYRNLLKNNAAPMLQYNKERVDINGQRPQRVMQSWGFSSKLVEEVEGLDNILDTNTALLMSDAYGDDEFRCYRAVYNIRAELLPKFNEEKKGIYYTSYQTLINNMLELQRGAAKDAALDDTPHLDKRWHSILPYITSNKQMSNHLSFYRNLWIAIAYGSITINKEGNFCLSKKVNTGFNNSFTKSEPVIYNGLPVAARDVVKFVEALRLDSDFETVEIPELEERYKKELASISTYESTSFIKGIRAVKAELNPIDMIVRYNRNKESDIKVLGALIGALEDIAYELANNYHDNSRSEKNIVISQYKILRKIYDSAALTVGKEDIFEGWLKMFDEYGIKSEASQDTTGGNDGPNE